MRPDTAIPSAAPPTLARKLEFLRDPASYPERPAGIEAIETHMSWVFLTERHAYKLKKPVRYAFLDFSSLAARRRDCARELRLNRRLAPQVYLGVVALTAGPDGGLALDGAGQAVDWLVKMRRLPRDRMLDQAIAAHTLQPAQIEALAEVLAAFFRRARPVAMRPDAYVRRIERDIRATLGQLAEPAFGLDAAQLRDIGAALHTELAELRERLAQRAARGLIIEGHGDLRPEHVCLLSPPMIIDCLEFNRAFRTLDPADELAFLAMECDALGAPWIGPLLFRHYRVHCQDAPEARLLRFYMACRACLRAKLSLWHLNDPQVRGRGPWIARAQRYLALAQGYLRESALQQLDQ